MVQVRGGVGNGGLVSMTPRASQMVGRANSSYSESNSTQSTPTKSVSKPPSSGFRSRGVDRSVGGGARARNLLHCIKECPFLVVQLLLLIVWKCLTLILKKTLRFGWNTMYR